MKQFIYNYWAYYRRISHFGPLSAGVMAITTHARGEKGYRLLQGDNLRKVFTDMITKLVSIVNTDYRITLQLRRQSLVKEF